MNQSILTNKYSKKEPRCEYCGESVTKSGTIQEWNTYHQRWMDTAGKSAVYTCIECGKLSENYQEILAFSKGI